LADRPARRPFASIFLKTRAFPIVAFSSTAVTFIYNFLPPLWLLELWQGCSESDFDAVPAGPPRASRAFGASFLSFLSFFFFPFPNGTHFPLAGAM